jgi:aspartyl-tRNA(Asn)/glutamyl-tRNA(Gln) amidotransferase subunit C
VDVTESLVRHVARLARIALTDEEVAATVPQLARILAYVEQVGAVAVDETAETEEAVPLDALRDDEPGPTLTRREVAGNAPAHDGAFLVVPRFLEEA